MSVKSTLWLILEKYDSQPEMSDFCDSLSKAIQDLELSQDDVLNIAAVSNLVDREDIEFIDQNIGICNVVF
jgi:hypothetical protein